MSTNHDAGGKSGGFWTTLPGILTAVAGVIGAVTGLLVAIDQMKTSGDVDGTADISAPASVSGSSPSSAAASAGGEGDALAGTWSGIASDPEKRDPFDVRLAVVAPCHLDRACGTIAVDSTPCAGHVTLVAVRGTTYEFYVDDFTADSASDCHPGAGDYFELVDAQTLTYTTDYNDTTGTLHRGG